MTPPCPSLLARLQLSLFFGCHLAWFYLNKQHPPPQPSPSTGISFPFLKQTCSEKLRSPRFGFSLARQARFSLKTEPENRPGSCPSWLKGGQWDTGWRRPGQGLSHRNEARKTQPDSPLAGFASLGSLHWPEESKLNSPFSLGRRASLHYAENFPLPCISQIILTTGTRLPSLGPEIPGDIGGGACEGEVWQGDRLSQSRILES